MKSGFYVEEKYKAFSKIILSHYLHPVAHIITKLTHNMLNKLLFLLDTFFFYPLVSRSKLILSCCIAPAVFVLCMGLAVCRSACLSPACSGEEMPAQSCLFSNRTICSCLFVSFFSSTCIQFWVFFLIIFYSFFFVRLELRLLFME